MKLREFVRLFTHIQLLPVLENGEETTLIGGQAVMEGVMMRSPHSYCVAVRKGDGEIVSESRELPRLADRYPLLKAPFVRGVATLGHAMWLGMKALKFSADCALDQVTGRGKPGAGARWPMALNIVFSIGFFLVFYKLVPLYVATLLGKAVPQMGSRFGINMVDGTIRIIFLLAFLFLLSRLKDIHRLFEFHGAEHRVVFNFESGEAVNVKTAQQFPTWHPRCGTSFLLVLMVIAMIFYAFLPFDHFWTKFAARIALLPVIVGVSYEIIRFAAKRRGGFLAILTQPGLWLQRITTQPPSGEQTEVAIHALERAMELERAQGGVLVIA